MTDTTGTKMALRRFTLRAAAGFRGAAGGVSFARELIDCFGPRDPKDSPVYAHNFDVVEDGKRTSRTVAAIWATRRVVLEVVDRNDPLDAAWRDLLRACLQLPQEPQWVVLTNQRDLHLYDLARDRHAPRLSIAVDELPKYSEALVFFEPSWQPGVTPKIVNVDKVSEEVADLVAKVFRALAGKHPKRRADVTRFILQCIVSMFAEDIGLLPKAYFTDVLYRAAAEGDAEGKLAALFAAMSKKGDARSGIPYFNGGLFSEPVTVPLDGVALSALTKAAEANWTFVDPHIFGSVFQGVMDEDERHAQGAHYTSREDILSVVGPTILEPWRRRIAAAKTLVELKDLLREVGTYRVLDPACGSGNFLYMAFRELYKVETEILCRIYEFASAQKSKPSWASNVRTTNFFGIDINPFAVELAKTTLNIAKKIAFEERRATVMELYGQGFLEVDPSLPLDNLNDNVIKADALFTPWPEADAIIGNPPFLGTQKMREELGGPYLTKLNTRYPQVSGDFCVHWFRLSHQRLNEGGRAGLIATSGIRLGNARESSLDFITKNGGAITDAISSKTWPGDATLHVSVVNWVRGQPDGEPRLVVSGRVYRPSQIHSHLQLHADVADASALAANQRGTSLGVIFGSPAFEVSGSLAVRVAAQGVLRATASGTDILTGKLESQPSFVIWLCDAGSEADARRLSPDGFAHLRKELYPRISERSGESAATSDWTVWLKRWWAPQKARDDFRSSFTDKKRVIACVRVQSRPIFFLMSTRFALTDSLQLFAFDDDYSFGIIQSSLHWAWTKARGGRLKADIRYTSEVWKSFPWPQEATEAHVVAVAEAARRLRATRARLMEQNGWSLRALYQSAEVEGAHPLKEAQAELDAAVDEAYGRPMGQEATEFLLELNLALAEDERAGHTIQGPGLPSSIAAKDRTRFVSADCIEPPPLPADGDGEPRQSAGPKRRKARG